MSEPKPILVLPTDTKAAVIAEAKKAGYCVIVCDEPSSVVVLSPVSRVSGDDLLMAAMHGLSGDFSESQRSRMFVELHRRMRLREPKPINEEERVKP